MNSKTVTEQFIKVAVWDTYVKRANGAVLHFDIIVPDHIKDAATVHAFGQEYLAQSGEVNRVITTQECQFCHIEEPSSEIMNAIAEKGYYILKMEVIPESLPSSPTRRDLILHLRAHDPNWRFADFGEKSEEEIRLMLQNRTNE